MDFKLKIKEQRIVEEKERKVIHKIEKHFGIISNNETSVEKELNLVRWGGNSATYDLRSWKENRDGTKTPFKGIVLSRDELRALKELLQEMEL